MNRLWLTIFIVCFAGCAGNSQQNINMMLPVDFPPIKITVSKPSQVQPGLILFSPSQMAYQGMHVAPKWLIAVDSTGKVEWYRKAPGTSYLNCVSCTHRNSLLCITSPTNAVEFSLEGKRLRRWYAARTASTGPVESRPVDIDYFHHDLIMLPDGNLLALTLEQRKILYPTSETDPAAPMAIQAVAGDVVVEFEPSGLVVQRWKLLDMLDPKKIGYDSLKPLSSRFYKSAPKDWGHSNAVVYDARDDGILVSLRHQDAVVKFSRKTGKLIWILSTSTNWKAPWKNKLLKLQGGKWQYHQHAPQITNKGVLLYDNGNHRASPFDGKTPSSTYSRAVEYAIDEKAMAATQIWEYKDNFFSPSLCDADRLQNGNVLITDGNREASNGSRYGRIVEITPQGQKVFELIVGQLGQDWNLYRAMKLKGI